MVDEILTAEIERLRAQVKAGTITGNFAESLLTQFKVKGDLSPKQWQWVTKLANEGEEKGRKRAINGPIAGKDGPFRALVARFEALGPKAALHLTAAGAKLRISKAGAESQNVGSLYVKFDGAYAGKITPVGFFASARDLHEGALDAICNLLERLIADFDGTVVEYGKETGVCCLCGALLTNEESVAAGIGPICGGRWGVRRPATQLRCEPEGLAA